MSSLLMLILFPAVAMAGKPSCIPFFYESLPRDGKYTYAVGAGRDAETARAEAVSRLGLTDSWEQDDRAVCDGVYYVMVRATNEAMAGAIAKRDKAKSAIIAKLEPRISNVEQSTAKVEDGLDRAVAHMRGQDLALLRLHARTESIKTGASVAGEEASDPAPHLAPEVEAAVERDLMPKLRASLANIEAGSVAATDMGIVMGIYQTLGQTGKMRSFCRKMLRQESRMSLGESLWISDRCRAIR